MNTASAVRGERDVNGISESYPLQYPIGRMSDYRYLRSFSTADKVQNFENTGIICTGGAFALNSCIT